MTSRMHGHFLYSVLSHSRIDIALPHRLEPPCRYRIPEIPYNLMKDQDAAIVAAVITYHVLY